MNDWESYWKTVYKNDKNRNIFWDSTPERAALEDIQRFKPYMNPDLPLLDLGCGNGRQTRFLSRYYNRVIGVDISSSAIRLAIEETLERENIEYRVFDALNIEQAVELHQEFGDMNLYMRGVLHMIKMHDRSKFISNLGILMGEVGVLYQIELPTEAFYYLRTLPEDILSSIPKIVRRVGFNLEDRASYYPDDQWIIIDEGNNVSINTGSFLERNDGGLPANFLILKKKISSSYHND
jgi:SAM-dependent methyltransferase